MKHPVETWHSLKVLSISNDRNVQPLYCDHSLNWDHLNSRSVPFQISDMNTQFLLNIWISPNKHFLALEHIESRISHYQSLSISPVTTSMIQFPQSVENHLKNKSSFFFPVKPMTYTKASCQLFRLISNTSSAWKVKFTLCVTQCFT